MVNQTQGEVTIQSVQARAGGRPIGARLQGQSLADLLRVNSGGTSIPSGGSVLLFMDVKYARNARRPTLASVIGSRSTRTSSRCSGTVLCTCTVTTYFAAATDPARGWSGHRPAYDRGRRSPDNR
jgi:hypothetical protein